MGGYILEHRTSRRLSPGRFHPRGATLEDGGVNFALYSRNAEEVYLLLFDDPGALPTDIIRLSQRTRFTWHTFVHGLGAGQLYGYKVRGTFNPAAGLRFNEHKLLLDPYARAFTGKCVNDANLLLPYDPMSSDADLSVDTRDNTSQMPKCVVVDDAFDWQGDRRLGLPFEKSIVYEVHLKGFTAHPSSGVSQPGTYLGFIEKIPYLRELGISAVELLPVHEHYVDDFLRKPGLTNYWGYNTVGFFAPESSYCTATSPGCQVAEFKTLVRELHRAGIEVILDVVYNHTGEGNELGPVMSFRGIDNPTYYMLTGPPSESGRYYMNFTGCGNTVNLQDPAVIGFVMDSLRYWADVMHVDGFRFDLASVLGREEGGFYRSASFFDAVSQDPVLSTVKLIAEPWDLGTYQLGNFPVDWSEWNGRFRDTVRRFVKGDGGQLADMGWRLTGSADLYADDGRSAYNSINFVTCHDGFTLNDLVSYDWKHNEANGENNQDGSNDNNSWNCGVEGETDNPEVIGLRRQLARNHFCALLFAAGTPMLLGGDEFLRTQKGNNNAYCQDNELSWFDWGAVERNNGMIRFVRQLIGLTRRYPILQRRRFFRGRDLNDNNLPDITWYGPDLEPPPWDAPWARTLCCLFDGTEEPTDGRPYTLFLILNEDPSHREVRLPRALEGREWRRLLDTSLPEGEEVVEFGGGVRIDPQDYYVANSRTTVLLVSD